MLVYAFYFILFYSVLKVLSIFGAYEFIYSWSFLYLKTVYYYYFWNIQLYK